MRPLPSVVFQQKLQERAGPSRAWRNINLNSLKVNLRDQLDTKSDCDVTILKYKDKGTRSPWDSDQTGPAALA